jgi:MFS transporter, CP family, cyanate transporter
LLRLPKSATTTTSEKGDFVSSDAHAETLGGTNVPLNEGRPADRPKPWRGRILFFLGLMLMALSLRHAVTGVSPLLSRIEEDVNLGAVGTTVLGMLPTIAFGIAGFSTPPIIRRLGPARVAVIAEPQDAHPGLHRPTQGSPRTGH